MKPGAVQRRAWARAGTTIGSAREIDRLAAAIIERIVQAGSQGELDSGSVGGAVEILGALRTFENLLSLPERAADWRFRMSRSGQSTSVDVDPRQLLDGWLTGADLAQLASRHLSQVPDPAWRIEQLVDAVTAHFQHFLAWTVSVLVEVVNQRLADIGTDARICPQLGPFIRYGVDTGEALALMVAGVRSRRLAHAIAVAAAADGGVDDVRAWLGRMSLPEWRERFGATATEILDLLDLTRARRRSILRTLLETGVSQVVVVPVAPTQELPGVITRPATDTKGSATATASSADDAEPGGSSSVTLSVSLAELEGDPEPRRLGAFDRAGALLAVVPASSHSDVKAVIDTGLATEAEIDIAQESPVLRITLADGTPAQA